jgi:nitrile hydratase accessory protein
MSHVDPEIAHATGAAALPRKNGELVFTAPWQGRVFGMALSLRQRSPYPWAEFRDHLEREIADAGPDDDGTRYYEHWLHALEELVVERGLVEREQLERRTEEYLSGEREEVF